MANYIIRDRDSEAGFGAAGSPRFAPLVAATRADGQVSTAARSRTRYRSASGRFARFVAGGWAAFALLLGSMVVLPVLADQGPAPVNVTGQHEVTNPGTAAPVEVDSPESVPKVDDEAQPPANNGGAQRDTESAQPQPGAGQADGPKAGSSESAINASLDPKTAALSADDG